MATAQDRIAIVAAPVFPTPARAWCALGLLFFAQMAAIGSTSYGFGLLVKPLSAEFGLPRADVNRGLMILVLGMAFFSPLIGRALDRLPARMVLMAGAIAFAGGWLAIAASRSIPMMAAAAFLLLASGTAALGPVTASTLTARWFVVRRGLALGIVSVSASAGGLVIVPAMAALIDHGDWRGAVATIGIVTGIAVVALAPWLLPREDKAAARNRARAAPPLTVAMLLRCRDFWLIGFAVGALMATNGALLASLIAYGMDRGFSLAQATMLVSTVSGAALIGKLVIGALADRIDPRGLYLVVVALNAALLIVLIAGPSYPLLLIAAVLAGPAVGGVMPLWGVIAGRRFGVASLGLAMGLTSPLTMPLNLLGLHVIGAAFDASGSYRIAFELFLVVLVLAALSILPVRLQSGDK
ncbi:MFS transporter [Sphingomonas sp. KC8]|uniref:MFS transporter n=1 Tax=Sphingomonas sp. KC8 TaxID=1030157 RepID=UPI000A31E28B|nr:MFS transporter [Sphingomonas sp. KC8]ARS28506.1 hypothetical protein KC8_14595 [Sphingomonas sp. KC8]